ncbi:MAG: MOSC domain-containing protein [Deinococcales bacterium]
MKIVSINVGSARKIQLGERQVSTGIFKLPQPRTWISQNGLEQDYIADQKHHGGIDQAVYVYTTEDYDWWLETLGRDLEPGTFGENLTISGFESANLHVGDRIFIGDPEGNPVVLEVTAPRIPFEVLAERIGSPAFVKHFAAAERPGAYCRVLEGGAVETGDPVTLQPWMNGSVTLLELMRWHYGRPLERDLKRALSSPIAERWRKKYEEALGIKSSYQNGL